MIELLRVSEKDVSTTVPPALLGKPDGKNRKHQEDMNMNMYEIMNYRQLHIIYIYTYQFAHK